VWRGCPVGNAASLIGDAVRRLSRQCGVRCEEGLLELMRWAGEIILKAIAVPGLFLLMAACTVQQRGRRWSMSKLWASGAASLSASARASYMLVRGSVASAPKRGRRGWRLVGICCVPSGALVRRLGWGFVGGSLPGSSTIIAAGGVCGYLASLRRLSARLGGRGGLGFWRSLWVSALVCLGGWWLGASSV